MVTKRKNPKKLRPLSPEVTEVPKVDYEKEQINKVKLFYKKAKTGLVELYQCFLKGSNYVSPAKFHFELSDLLLNNKDNFVIEAFRESAKSSYVMQAFPVYCLLFPSPERQYIIFIKQNQRLAEAKLKDIVSVYLSNPAMRINVVRINEESVKCFDVVVRDSNNKQYNIRIESYGKGSSLRGLIWKSRRPDIVILDDVQDLEDSNSETIQEKDLEWFLSDIKPLGKNTRIFMIGNNLGEKCLIQMIIKNAESLNFNAMIMPALKDGIATWKEMFDEEYLQKEKQSYILSDKLEIWYRERMCLSMAEEKRIFKKAYFMYYEKCPEFKTIVVGVDLAISKRDTADYTAIVTVGVTASNEIYILDVIKAKMHPDEIIDCIFRVVKKYNPNLVGIEDVAYQKMLILEVHKQMRLRNIFFNLTGVKPMGEKESRIQSILQPRFSNRSVYHKKDFTSLESELLMFPKAEHDDQIDALSIALKLLNIEFEQKEQYNYNKTKKELFTSDFAERFPEEYGLDILSY